MHRPTMTGAGLVDERSARIWLRTDRSGPITLEWTAIPHPPAQSEPLTGTGILDVRLRPGADGTTSFVYPDEFVGGSELPPHSRVAYRILRPAASGAPELLATGRFDTAPSRSQTPARSQTPDAPHPAGSTHLSQDGAASDPSRPDSEFSLALFSCNQPFDEAGNVHDYALRAFEQLPGVFEQYAVRRVLALGDQMYTDFPASRSLYNPEYFCTVAPPGRKDLFACTRQEVRDLLHARYRDHFGVEGFNYLISQYATTMILDDHEIVDNIGTAPEHSTEKWHNIRHGGLDAAFNYEALRQQPPSEERPSSFHYDWQFGPVATFVMDLRSQRVGRDDELQFFDQAQLDALTSFLQAHEQSPVLVLGLSIPLAFLPEKFVLAGIMMSGEGSDAAERWWNERAQRNRQQLLDALSAHRQRCPEQLLIIATGDVHVGMVNRLQLEGGDALQIISSAISNREGALARAIAKHVPKLGSWTKNQVSWDFLENRAGGGDTCSGLNVGLISVRTASDGHVSVVLRIVLLGEKTGPQVVFESEPLSAGG